MFAISDLFSHSGLEPLKKVYEHNEYDPRLVVVAEGDGANIIETISLHKWLASVNYQHIPATWESADLFEFDVVHVSKLTVKIVRRNPFAATPSPLPPNSWLNRLDQKRFDALLLAQQTGNIQFVPSAIQIKDEIKPKLEAEQLSGFWAEMVDTVVAAQSGAAPRNSEQKRMFDAWKMAENRRHYDPTAAQSTMLIESTPVSVSPTAQQYVWSDDGNPYKWNRRMIALRDWICTRTRETSDLRVAAMQVLGTVAHVAFYGKIKNDADNLVHEAMLRGKLDALAMYYDYVQPQEPPSAFNQSGQTVMGAQINVGNITASSGIAIGTNIVQNVNTDGGAYIGGKLIANGGFVGGDLTVNNIISK